MGSMGEHGVIMPREFPENSLASATHLSNGTRIITRVIPKGLLRGNETVSPVGNHPFWRIRIPSVRIEGDLPCGSDSRLNRLQVQVHHGDALVDLLVSLIRRGQ